MLIILAMTRFVADAVREGPEPRARRRRARSWPRPGSARSCWASLQSSTWGVIKPKDSPIEPFGFSLTLFVIAGGAALIWGFVRWQRHREAIGDGPAGPPRPAEDPAAAVRADRAVLPEPDPHGRLLHHPAVPAARPRARRPRDRHQDAAGLDHDVPRLGHRLAPVEPVPRAHDRPGRPRGPPSVAALLLLATIDPTLADGRVRDVDGPARRRHGADGLPARQRGAVLGRRVGSGRGRWPPVHRPAARLVARRRPHRRDRARRAHQRVRGERRGRRAHQRRGRGRRSAWPPARGSTSWTPIRSRPPPRRPASTRRRRDAIVDDYEEAQLQALKAGLLAAAFLAFGSLAFTRDLPHEAPTAPRRRPGEPVTV